MTPHAKLPSLVFQIMFSRINLDGAGAGKWQEHWRSPHRLPAPALYLQFVNNLMDPGRLFACHHFSFKCFSNSINQFDGGVGWEAGAATFFPDGCVV